MALIKSALPLLALVISADAQSGVYMAQYDNTRAGATQAEAIITPGLISAGNFGITGRYVVDGIITAQTLYAPRVTMSGGAVHDLLIVATLNDSIYAFDADAPGSAYLWKTTVATPRTTGIDSTYHNEILYGGGLGCLPTPVIDSVNGWIFEACGTNATSPFVCGTNVSSWVLYKIALSSGAVLSSRTIAPTVSGSGDTKGAADCVSAGTLQFYSDEEAARSALTLVGSNVYVAFTAINPHPGHGWIVKYDESTLTQQAVFCTSPNSDYAGIWMSGGGPAVDGSGNLYFSTADGTYNGTDGFGDSIVKLDSNLNLVDWFTPTDQASLYSSDADLGSCRAFLVPGTKYLICAAKDFIVRVIDTTCMGHLQGSSGCTLQTFKTDASGTLGDETGTYGGMFMVNQGIFPVVSDPIYSFNWTGSSFNTTATTSMSSWPYVVTHAGSSLNGSNPILWAVTPTSDALSQTLGTLRALNPSTLAQYGSWGIGHLSKWGSPTIADGKLFVANSDEQVVSFGAVYSVQISGQVTVSGQVTIQ